MHIYIFTTSFHCLGSKKCTVFITIWNCNISSYISWRF